MKLTTTFSDGNVNNGNNKYHVTSVKDHVHPLIQNHQAMKDWRKNCAVRRHRYDNAVPGGHLLLPSNLTVPPINPQPIPTTPLTEDRKLTAAKDQIPSVSAIRETNDRKPPVP